MTLESIARLIRNPLLVLDAEGRVVDANALGLARFGTEVVGRTDLFESPQALRSLIRRASGVAAPVTGALEFARLSNAPERLRVELVALRGQPQILFAMEIREKEASGFSILNERLNDLKAEILVRQKSQAMLEESLAHNQFLYRELQHRVKNHLQMITSLVSAAGRESDVQENRTFANALVSKLSALFDAQRLMYAEGTSGSVSADEIIRSITATVGSVVRPGVAITVRADSILISNDIAFPLALIANELIVNAVKYGAPESGGAIHVSLQRSGPEAVLEVSDSGPGFVAGPPTRSSSGLGLVRGLCRQIGGRLDIQSSEGCRVGVTFTLPAHPADGP